MSRRTMRSAVALGVVLAFGMATAAKTAEGSYWEWGWGTYGSKSALDVARYDWSLINFGNVSADERTVLRCNEILKINPQHKFVVRIWPIMGKGDCKENRHQATLFHYLYKEGVREKVLAETRRQLRLVIDGVRLPQSVVGSTFLEELPSHFTSSPFKSKWRPGDSLPWAIKRFEQEIAAELGEPFDMAKPEHRLWWGSKYAQVLGEIHRAMKEAGEGRLVIYWQATAFHTLDHDPEGAALCKPRIVPIHYRDIVKPGVCDGIFGYPNNDKVWNRQTRAIVEKIHCRFFSQLSTPPFMRIARFEQTVELTRWHDPGNLGTFLYMQGGRSSKAWNELPHVTEGRYWTIADHARKFAWDHKVGLDIVDRFLAPQTALDYQAENKRKGDFIHVWGQVRNPRDPSWYGGETDRAVLRSVKLTLTVPDGFVIPLENSAPPTVELGNIPAKRCLAADWWVRVSGDGTIPAGQAFRLTAVAGDSARSAVSCRELKSEIPSLRPHEISRSGDTWVEPGYRLSRFQPTVELTARKGEIVFPSLESGSRTVLYRHTLTPGTRLVIGPGYKAVLFSKPLVDHHNPGFAKQRNATGMGVFSKGYPVHRSPRVRVRPGAEYRFRVTGEMVDGAIFHALVMFTGKQGGKPARKEKSCFYNALRNNLKTVETTVVSPDFSAGNMWVQLFFYCHNKQGALHLKAFDFTAADIPDSGLDVTSRLEGVLPKLERPFTTWTYKDRSDPLPHGGAKLDIRFFNPAEAETEAIKEREGADDF